MKKLLIILIFLSGTVHAQLFKLETTSVQTLNGNSDKSATSKEIECFSPQEFEVVLQEADDRAVLPAQELLVYIEESSCEQVKVLKDRFTRRNEIIRKININYFCQHNTKVSASYSSVIWLNQSFARNIDAYPQSIVLLEAEITGKGVIAARGSYSTVIKVKIEFKGLCESLEEEALTFN
ncbi:MAG: hypothetical protein HON90_11520 [Halobacteriovoraceae bacterium]|jgi:hypothetical protein|nr:hypothetical protein [Halobacteriovoraceae bacterium]